MDKVGSAAPKVETRGTRSSVGNTRRPPAARPTEESHPLLPKPGAIKATDGFVFKQLEMQQISEVTKRWQQREHQGSVQ